MTRNAVFVITGAPCTGKSTLAAWLCRRLPQPVAGLRTLCTGRCEAGALFSLQNLADGTVTPVTQREAGQVTTLYTVWDSNGAGVLQAALQGESGTILVDEALPPNPHCPAWNEALAAVLAGSAPWC